MFYNLEARCDSDFKLYCYKVVISTVATILSHAQLKTIGLQP